MVQNSCDNLNKSCSRKPESEEKKYCGFFGAHVCISEYNDYGKCGCLGCMGLDCQYCKNYALLLDKLSVEKLKCQNCMNYKTR